jgi:predicted lactoylglutathione lyase
MKNTYINLPIRSVVDTDTFFASLGMEKNKQFSSEDTTNAKINDNTFVMLLEDKRFATFVSGDPEVINNNLTIALQFDSKDEVDTFFEKAITAGATDSTKASPESDVFMYGKAFRDINGHVWELFTFVAKMPDAS